jgi:hypothetical protein
VSAIAPDRPSGAGRGPRDAFRDLVSREPALAWFGIATWLAALPVIVAFGLDDRMLRELNVWIKPLKFLASTGLFALTTAWFVGLLPPARRRSAATRAIVWTVIVTSVFEVGYISLQAALGQASHYNVGDALHGLLYAAMGAAAVALAATQPALAWLLHRHGDLPACAAWRDGVLWGLVLTFVLGAGAGIALGDMRQPPAGPGLPLVGWHGAGDLRPAHFIGIHAQQLLPLAGLALDALWPRRARPAIAVLALAYVAGWFALMAMGLARA